MGHFDELYVNFQLFSVFRSTYTFAQIRLLAPDGQVQILPDGRFNFSDIILLPGTSDSSNEQKSTLPPVHISRLQIEKGSLEFSDLSHPTPFEATLSPIKLSILIAN
ncbi:MAG: DUF748 domain-containing protein [Planctomycetes bacterium]|nr:DUF748 domain-containing protein [Planctomycetota bacterium]